MIRSGRPRISSRANRSDRSRTNVRRIRSTCVVLERFVVRNVVSFQWIAWNVDRRAGPGGEGRQVRPLLRGKPRTARMAGSRQVGPDLKNS